ncbi:MAG: MarR family transcriptional regulator [Candidatus Odinarchaeota archaeon]
MTASPDPELLKKLTELINMVKETNEKLSAMENRIEKIEGKIRIVDELKQPVDGRYGEKEMIDPSDLSPTQLQILAYLSKRNTSDVYELESKLKKTRHYVNTSLKELYSLGLLKRVKNVNKEESAVGEKHPRYFYKIDGKKMQIKEMQQQIEGL